MNANLERLKALVTETNEVVANLNKETENIELNNQGARAEKFREIRDYLMECYKIAQECGSAIKVEIKTSVRYLDYDTTTFLRISGSAKSKKPIQFEIKYIDKRGDERHDWPSDSYGIGPDTEWKNNGYKQCFFGTWFNESDENDFVDKWNQEEFEKKFAAEIEKAITEKASKANEKYQTAVNSSELLRR